MISIIKKVLSKVFPSEQARRVKPWTLANGDKTLRLNYDLNEDSLVFDLGGYEGQWASDIFSKYLCKIFVFEPSKPYAANIKSRFSRNKFIQVFDFGLGQSEKVLKLYSSNDSSSVFKKHGIAYDIEIRNATNFISSKGITKIDLIKINIEGGEYELLEDLIRSEMIKNIKNIQVQFHDFVPNAFEKMKSIQNALQKTHSLTYQYEFVWENWVLNEAPES